MSYIPMYIFHFREGQGQWAHLAEQEVLEQM